MSAHRYVEENGLAEMLPAKRSAVPAKRLAGKSLGMCNMYTSAKCE